jgi:mRNA-degrading endonuclease RelE of RelBE toxin-antitoxin system
LSEAEGRYSVAFTNDAFADVKALDGSIKTRLKKVLTKKLAMDPQGYGLPLRSPLNLYWKHEFSTRRVIYRIYEEKRFVVICAVGPRKQGDAEDVYEQFQALAQTGKVAQQIADVLSSLAPHKKKNRTSKTLKSDFYSVTIKTPRSPWRGWATCVLSGYFHILINCGGMLVSLCPSH